MKRFLLLSIMMTLLISCNSNQKKLHTEKRKADSLIQILQLEREKFLADSLSIAQRREQAITAFGGIKFGMSKDTVKAIMEKTFQQGASKILGAYSYSFSPVFNNSGQLYMLQLQTAPESSLQLESTVMARVQNLKQIISAKYGEPQKSFAFPDDFAFVESNLQWTNIWKFDTKTIKIGVAAEPEGSLYKAVCWIYDDPIRVKQLNKGKDILLSKIEKAASDF